MAQSRSNYNLASIRPIMPSYIE